jgi:tetratricopeptide (TPR) repeat protein
VEELRRASEQDRNRVNGEQAIQRAENLLDKGDEQSARAALAMNKTTLKLCGQPADDRCMADVLNSTCGIHYALNEGSEALQCFEEVLPIYQRLHDRQSEAETLNNIGHYYDVMGKLEKALARFHQASEIAKSFKTKKTLRLVGAILNNIGAVYARIDNLDQALDKFLAALPIFQQLKDREPEAILRGNIGHIYLEEGKVQDALNQFSVAEPMHKKGKESLEKAILFNNIGRARMLLNDPKQALAYFDKALPIFRALADGAQLSGTLNNMGQATAAIGNSEKALEYYNEALGVQGSEPRTVIAILGNLGTHYEATNRPKDALEQYEKGIAFIESLRRSSSVEEARESLSEALSPFVFKASYLQFRFGDQSRAFNLTELARARTLLDQLGSGHFSLIRSSDPQLSKDRTDLESTLNRLEQQLEARGTEKSGLKLEYAAAQRRYEDWLLQAKISDSKPTSSPSAKTLSVSEVQQQLDSDTTVLSYFVLPDVILAFVITRDSFHAVELPVKETDLFDQVYWFRRFPNTETPSDERLKRLYEWVINPIKQYLRTPKVCIIPHRELNYVLSRH